MFEINRRPMITEIRCGHCYAAMEINTDHKRLIERSIAEFERRHICRNTENHAAIEEN